MGLRGRSVLVAGAGLAGLAAARDLLVMGAEVTVIDARTRVGGRVWTIRDGFAVGQHAEAGGDIIDEGHDEIRHVAEELGLKLTRILRKGFSAVRPDASGRPRIVHRGAERGWARLRTALEPLARPYRLAEQRWDSPIAAALARRTVASWLEEIKADEELRATAVGLRGFFLADPQDLSLLALVDQFASDDSPVAGAMYRVEGGNDRIATALAAALGARLRLTTELVAISHRGRGVRATVRNGRSRSTIVCDYLLVALPLTVLRRIPITPGLRPPQHEAIVRLPYGRATKTLLQFPTRFWRALGRGRAFGSPLPFGAVWDGNEEQRGQPGILALLAGGSASDATDKVAANDGVAALANQLDWLGPRGPVIGSHQAVWTTDPWSRGGYAYFDTGFDPALRAWLARPFGRLFFAGEHTSIKWQGYMNGAVESGRRAAFEIASEA
jgi:monoamine oxidase